MATRAVMAAMSENDSVTRVVYERLDQKRRLTRGAASSSSMSSSKPSAVTSDGGTAVVSLISSAMA